MPPKHDKMSEPVSAKTRTIAAKLIHDLRTPLFTAKNFAHQLPEREPEIMLAKMAINKQIDTINARLDTFWQEMDSLLEPTELSPPHMAEPIVHPLRPAMKIVADNKGSAEQNDVLTAPSKPLHILVVDDDMLIRDIAERILRKDGHYVDSYSSGKEALARCTAVHFDAVFLDMNMPGLSGLDMATAIPALSVGLVAPYMIGMSSDPRVEETREKCLRAGMDIYIEKPLTIKKCTEVLSQL
ncbi:MAG: response regulator [Kordiimonadaceae bacterium]|nr:response regulator [Kordiimonadaceae bacterium]